MSIHKDSKYLYYCDNETIHGVEFQKPIVTENIPIVCDMTSNFMSRQVNWDHYDVVLAGVQKNLGPAGICSVIMKKSLLKLKRPDTPILCDWETNLNAGGFYNTPNVFAVYMCALVLKHMKPLGLDHYDELARRRSSIIYELIDGSNGFYTNLIDKRYRSRMNVSFKLKTKEDDVKFCQAAKEEGLLWLAGHAKYGGCRASMYNAMPMEGVEKLAQFMKKYQDENEKL